MARPCDPVGDPIWAGSSTGSGGWWAANARAGASHHAVALYPPVWAMLGSAEALSWGPATGIGSCLPSSCVLGQRDSTGLSQSSYKEFDLVFCASASVGLTPGAPPQQPLVAYSFFTEDTDSHALRLRGEAKTSSLARCESSLLFPTMTWL